MARPHNLNGGNAPNVKFVQPPAPMTGIELRKIKNDLGYTNAHLAYALGLAQSTINNALQQGGAQLTMPMAMAVRYYLLTKNLPAK